MNIDYTGRHFQLDDRTKDYTDNKLSKLVKFLEEPIEAHVVFEIEKHRQIAELHIAHRHGVLQAKEEAENLLDAVHAAVEKIEKQARRSHKKHTDKRRRAAVRTNGDLRHWPLDILEAGSLQAGEEPKVIRKTVLQIKPMTVDEAAIQLDMSKNEFFVFLDSSSDRVSVLYKRRDNHYGLIAPEF
jgi:ribosome hibernation promoting factor